MPDAEAVGEGGLEVVKKRAAERIRDLQRRAKEHGEDEEDHHPVALEQDERVEAELRGESAPLAAAHRRARRRGERIKSEQHRGARAHVELQRALRHTSEIDHPHRGDETDRAPHADRRKMLHDVELLLFQHFVRHGVVERDRRHIDHRVEQHDRVEHFVPRHGARPEQQSRAGEVAEAEDPLRVHESVGDDAEQAGHEERGDAHGGVHAADLRTREAERHDHVAAHGDQPGAPHEELQEVHDRQAELDAHGRPWVSGG